MNLDRCGISDSARIFTKLRPFTWKDAELGLGGYKNTNFAQISLKLREKGSEAALLQFKNRLPKGPGMTHDMFGKKNFETLSHGIMSDRAKYFARVVTAITRKG